MKNENGTSTAFGIVMLLFLTVLAVTAVSAFMYLPLQSRAPYASIAIESARVINEGNDTIVQKITLMHRMGETVNVSEIKIITSVNGQTLTNQLYSLPRTSAKGYNGIGGVLFGWSKDTIWNTGDIGTYNIASGTSGKKLKKGDKVTVKIIHVPSNMVITESTATVLEEK